MGPSALLVPTHGTSERVYIAPTGVQKERIAADELFVLDRRSRDVLRAPSKPLKQSACTPLFFHCYDIRDAGACIHSHSQATVMATLLWPGREFRISHQEMIKVRVLAPRNSAFRSPAISATDLRLLHVRLAPLLLARVVHALRSGASAAHALSCRRILMLFQGMRKAGTGSALRNDDTLVVPIIEKCVLERRLR